MTGWSRVEDYMIVFCEPPCSDERCEFLEGRDLDRAGSGQAFLHASNGGFGQDPAQGADRAFAIGCGRLHRVDVEGKERAGDVPWIPCQPDAQHFIEIRCRIGAHKQNPPSCICQPQRGRAGQRRLPHAAFSGKK